MSRSRLPTAILFVCSLLVSLALGELILRWMGFEFQLYPVRVEFGWPDPVKLEKEFDVDQKLLWVTRGYYDRLAKLRGSNPSIVYMGDSCTAWGAYDKALKHLIQTRHPDGLFSYVNAGVGGWSSFQGLQQMQRDILPILPKLITVYYGWNDHWASFGVEDKEVARFNLDYPLSVSILGKLRLAQLGNYYLIKLYGEPEKPRRPERVSPRDFRENLTAIVRLARANNILPVLLTAPSTHRRGAEPAGLPRRLLNNIDDLVPLHTQYVEIVREVAGEHNVLLLDLFAIFSRLPQDVVAVEYFVDDGIHFTTEGSFAVAHALYKFLELHELIDLVVE